jgi:hypothetical protein
MNRSTARPGTYGLRARRAGPVVGGGGAASGFATLRMRERSPSGCEHLRRAHSAGRGPPAPDATRPASLWAAEQRYELRERSRRLDPVHD